MSENHAQVESPLSLMPSRESLVRETLEAMRMESGSSLLQLDTPTLIGACMMLLGDKSKSTKARALRWVNEEIGAADDEERQVPKTNFYNFANDFKRRYNAHRMRVLLRLTKQVPIDAFRSFDDLNERNQMLVQANVMQALMDQDIEEMSPGQFSACVKAVYAHSATDLKEKELDIKRQDAERRAAMHEEEAKNAQLKNERLQLQVDEAHAKLAAAQKQFDEQMKAIQKGVNSGGSTSGGGGSGGGGVVLTDEAIRNAGRAIFGS